MIKLKRIYEKPEQSDGYRVLVDRLWPRGVSKEKASLDLWLKEIAPSTKLRQWFGHDVDKWTDFRNKYTVELKANSEVFDELKEVAKKNTTVTLLYAARDETHNEAVIIRDLLK